MSKRGVAFTVAQELVTEACCNCNMLFAMPNELKERALKKRGPNGIVFYCPAGHRQWYVGETEEDKLRRERDRLKQDQAWYEDRNRQLREEADHQRHRANGYKGHATRITKRAKAGVCPCCNRTFKQLAAHMASQHPQFTPLEEEAVSG